ncbi:protein with putative role during mitosis [Eutypa lata]|nr:protein with putative role during mitosis [Eutypa lata]
MSPMLSDRQAEELHKALLAYLLGNGLHDTASAFRQELGLGEDIFDATMAKKYEILLEKKWISVIMELETRNAALQSDLENLTPGSRSQLTKDPSSWLPSAAPRYTLESHRGTINCVAFHPIFSSIATGSDDYTIKIWDWEEGSLERTIKGHTRAVTDLDYGGPKGGVLLASSSADLSIKLWDPMDEYKNVRTLVGHEHSVSAVRFISPSGTSLVSASRDQTLRIWDTSTGYCTRTLHGHVGWVRDVSPSDDGRFLLSTGDDMSARLWDISTSGHEIKAIMTGHEHFNECCALAPPTSYQHIAALAGVKAPPASSAAEFMATGSRDKTIKIWDARGTCLLTLTGHDNWVRAIVFHPGGKYLLSVSDDKTLRCWDLTQGGKCVRVLGDTHERFVTSLRWAPSLARSLGLAGGGEGEKNRTSLSALGKPDVSTMQICCVIATGGVDTKLRIFAN